MDNSFATKRWTTPDEWARIIRDFGICCIEASTDTEADPFYCGADYLDEWIEQVREASRSYGVRVANFYTGYTTYRTLGLAHPDARVRQRIMNGWLKVMARIAARIHAGLGFYIHAFAESVLQDPAAYTEAKDRLYDSLAEVARFAGESGPIPIIVEQMYTPHQIPWTIEGTLEYVSEVSRRSGFPAYVAMDTGHQTGQHRFLRASREEIERCLKAGGPAPFLGPEYSYAVYDEAAQRGAAEIRHAVERIGREMDRCPYLFAQERDCDLYRWLEEVGCYSSIVHLQQSNGKSSSHLPFIPVYNEVGIVHPPKVLQALARSYDRPPRPGMPPRCDDIYLTFEIFPRMTDSRREILSVLAESARYWRQWIPEDGASLGSLLDRCGKGV
ncbi:MAG: TIM barrel protein [Spirochaetes bacterium]|nr:TIM barrel protein [Spirochaetota bacterium]